MMESVRRLNDQGLERFRAYLDSLREGSTDEPPDLLWHAQMSAQVPGEARIDDERQFENSYDMGHYLQGALSGLDPDQLLYDGGLWSWLGLYYFDEICPRQPDGTRRPREDARYLLSLRPEDQDFRTRYRHLLATPYFLVRLHGEHARVLLGGEVFRHSDMVEQLASRQDVITNRSLVRAIYLLYYDEQRDRSKVGASDRKRPGNVRRFVSLMQQFDLTFDLYGMSGEEIVDLLPDEFSAWRDLAVVK